MGKTQPLSFRQEFEEWMREYRMYDEGTIATRIANVERIEKGYGSLLEHWKKDNFESLFDELAYSKTDELYNRKYSGPIEINGNLYNNLSTYRAALRLYSSFLSAQKSDIVGYPFGEIGKRVKSALKQLSKSTKKKGSYNAEEVKELIIKPLTALLTLELSPFGYEFSTEKVAMVNTNKKATKDRYDIFGEAENQPVIIVEVDTHRADQVAKKVVSRVSFNLESEVLYVALVYPNEHQNMEAEKKECKKYFRFINTLFTTYSTPQKHFMHHWLFK